jgi:hypothetical protein
VTSGSKSAKKKQAKILRESQQANDRGDDNAASDDDDDDDDAPAPIRRLKRAGDSAALELGDSCTWSEDSRDMIPSVLRSHNAPTTDYVCHVAQFCEDNNASQERYCWPFILEVARSNKVHFDSSYPAQKLKDFVARARCPSAYDAGHCRAQHEHLADALMAQLASKPYLQET